MQRPDDHPVRGFLQIGFFLVGGGFLMAAVNPPTSPEFVVSVCSGLMGVFLVLTSALLVRWMRRER